MKSSIYAFTASVLTLALTASSSFAASVANATWNAEAQTLTVDLTYGGGCKEHTFSLKLQACAETSPVRCRAAILEKTIDGPDLCEALLSKTVTFKASDYGLDKSCFDDASLEVFGSDNQAKLVKITRADQDQGSDHGEQDAVVCTVSNDRFVKFVPAYGEVQFLKADGSSWKQHHDGLQISVLSLESRPVQIRATIKDDEGTVIGRWSYVQGASKFSVQYLGSVYNSCRAL